MIRNSGLSHCAKSSLSRPEKTMKEIMSPREKVGGGVMEEKTHSGSCNPWGGHSHCQRHDAKCRKGQARNTPFLNQVGSQRTKKPRYFSPKKGLKSGKERLRRDFREEGRRRITALQMSHLT